MKGGERGERTCLYYWIIHTVSGGGGKEKTEIMAPPCVRESSFLSSEEAGFTRMGGSIRSASPQGKGKKGRKGLRCYDCFGKKEMLLSNLSRASRGRKREKKRKKKRLSQYGHAPGEKKEEKGGRGSRGALPRKPGGKKKNRFAKGGEGCGGLCREKKGATGLKTVCEERQQEGAATSRQIFTRGPCTKGKGKEPELLGKQTRASNYEKR